MARKAAVRVTRDLIERVQAAKKRSPVPSHQELAREFPLGLGTISNIVKGRGRALEDTVGDLGIEPNETCEWHYDQDVATLAIRAFDLKGLCCHRPGAAHAWDIETCRGMVMSMIEQLLATAAPA